MTKSRKLFWKFTKKVDGRTMAELKCNHWRRDSITNITSDVVAFFQLSAHKLSTFFEIFKNFEKFKKILKHSKFLKNSKILEILFFWKIQKGSVIHFLKFSKFLYSSEFFKNFQNFKKKSWWRPIAELKCNHWRRDSITNITSDVVAFCQLSTH